MPEVVRRTAAAVCYFASGIDAVNDSMTCLVKATFALTPGDLELVDPQPFPTGDEPYDGDEEGETVRYASDFAPFKPRADVLLVGHCHVPGDAPAPSCHVRLAVGELERTLVVFGDRHRIRGGLRSKASEPEPFTEMELRYERAYGGPKYEYNPIGRGHKSDVTNRPIPNIETPLDRTGSRRTPMPAGFGPLGMTWKQRRSKAGTYKRDWQQRRWPHVAADFDWGFHNAAPEAQQVDGYLRGDEEVLLENLLADHAVLRTRLPGLRPRAFVDEVDGAFREVELVLDTLWIDTDASVLTLVWRGHTPVRSEDFDEIRAVYFDDEPLGAPRSLEECEAAYRAAVAEDEEQWNPPPEPEPESEPDPEPGPGEEDEDPLDEHPQLKKVVQQAEAAAIAFGIDPKNLPVSPESEAIKKQYLKEWGFPDLDKEAAGEQLERDEPALPEPKPWTRDRVAAAVAEGRLLAGEDLGGLDLSGLDLQRAILAEADLSNADLSGADLRGAVLAFADLTEANLSGAGLVQADLSGSTLANANLEGADCTDALFESARLPSARLVDLSARDATFAAADLTGAVLVGADLREANLAAACLEQADLTDAKLGSAKLDGANAKGACFLRADLTELRASEEADFSGCDLREVQGPRSMWEHVALADADLRHARLPGAHFNRGDLARADFTHAELTGASFRKASLNAAVFVSANLFEAQFDKADLSEADLRGANAYGAEFLDATLDGLKRDGANFKATKLARG